MGRWEAITNNAIDIKGHKDLPFVGTYTGKKDITTKVGPSIVWQFTDEDDQPFAIYGFTMLNRAMEGAGIGTLCRITYKGSETVQTKYGLKPVHQVLVERHIGDKTDHPSTPEDAPSQTNEASF